MILRWLFYFKSYFALVKAHGVMELFHYRKQAITFTTCSLLTQICPFFSHKRSWPHVHTFMHQPVTLTQHRPVTHFPLVVRPFTIYPVACESSDCCVKPCITVIALLVGKAFHFERKDILHVEDMGVFTSTAVQTSLSCMYPLCIFVSHLQHFKSQKLTKSHHFIQWHVNVTCC